MYVVQLNAPEQLCSLDDHHCQHIITPIIVPHHHHPPPLLKIIGRCPRVHCDGQPCLPVGLSDVPRQSTVKIFCPKCEDVYYPRSRYQGQVDGAFFGTTFPHLFLLTYSSLRPPKPTVQYVPKVFGFKIHPTAYQRGPGQRGDNGRGRGQRGAARLPSAQGGGQEDQPATSNCTQDMQQ